MTEALLGSYVGEWKLLGVDATGTVVKTQWRDELTVTDCVELEDRCQVTGLNAMYFGEVRAAYVFHEGYLKGPDDEAGARFMEIDGKTVLQTELAPGVFVFPVEVRPQDLLHCGIAPEKLASSKHLMIKVMDGDTELVTRLSYFGLGLHDQSGASAAITLPTVQGYHRRVRDVTG